jgi:hypothetical protein
MTVDNPAIPANVYGRGIRVKPALVAAKFGESGQQGLWQDIYSISDFDRNLPLRDRVRKCSKWH